MPPPVDADARGEPEVIDMGLEQRQLPFAWLQHGLQTDFLIVVCLVVLREWLVAHENQQAAAGKSTLCTRVTLSSLACPAMLAPNGRLHAWPTHVFFLPEKRGETFPVGSSLVYSACGPTRGRTLPTLKGESVPTLSQHRRFSLRSAHVRDVVPLVGIQLVHPFACWLYRIHHCQIQHVQYTNRPKGATADQNGSCTKYNQRFLRSISVGTSVSVEPAV